MNAGRTQHFGVPVGDDDSMTTVDRSRGGIRRARLGAAAGAAIALASTLLARSAGWAVNRLWHTPDANIGLGLLVLAAEAVLTAVGVWLVARRLGAPAAGLIGTGAVVVYAATLFVSILDPASIASAVVQAV